MYFIIDVKESRINEDARGFSVRETNILSRTRSVAE